jgi:iron complex outermembrane receptor protein
MSYRRMRDDFSGRGALVLEPAQKADQLVSGFVQDEIRLAPALRVVVGTKLEHNGFSGFELQPSGRISWSPSPRQAVWGSVSRAVRTPTRIERDVYAPLTDPTLDPRAALLGNPDLGAEELTAFELGYRAEAERVFLDLAVYYNLYESLVTFGLDDPILEDDGRTLVPVRSFNAMDGAAYGGEAAVEWFPRPWWRISTSYSFLELRLDASAQALSPEAAAEVERASPRHQAALRSWLDLPHGFALDAALRWVDELPAGADPAVAERTPAYASLDLRLGWSAWKRLRMSVVGQNLLQGHHTEFQRGTAVQRGVYGKLTWSW